MDTKTLQALWAPQTCETTEITEETGTVYTGTRQHRQMRYQVHDTGTPEALGTLEYIYVRKIVINFNWS